MKVNKNKGMYLETIINNSIRYYEINQIALIRKQFVPVKITRVINQNVTGKLSNKGDVDYYGIYHGRFFAMEAKQTQEKVFYINNLLNHQQSFLKLIHDFNGLAYLMVFFSKTYSFYFVEYIKVYKYINKENKNINHIEEEWFNTHGIRLELMFPGRLDFLKWIKF